MTFRTSCLGWLVCLAFGWLTSVAIAQEQALPADKAPPDAPLKSMDKLPRFELSGLKKGAAKNGGIPRAPGFDEFSFDYVRQREGVFPAGISLVAVDPDGHQHEYSGGMFGGNPFSDARGSITASSRFPNLLPGQRGLGDNFEIFLVANVNFEGKNFRFKVSNSVSLGNVPKLTPIREWNANEQELLARWQKSMTPPGAPPADHVKVGQEKLVSGMKVLGGWMAEWKPAEVIDDRTFNVLVKFDDEISTNMVTLNRDWICVSTAELRKSKKSPGEFKPSIRVVKGGMTPIPDDHVLIPPTLKLVPGIQLQDEWFGAWRSYTLVKITADNQLRVVRDDEFGHEPEDKARDKMVISEETLEMLKTPDAASHFKERLDELVDAGTIKLTKDKPRHLAVFHNKGALPKNAEQVTDETPLKEGTPVGGPWFDKWRDGTVKELYEDGSVRVKWNQGGEDDVSRDDLIIDKKILAKLNRQATAEKKGDAEATSKKKEPTTSSKPSTAGISKKKAKSDDEDGAPATEGCQVILTKAGKSKIALVKIVMEVTGFDAADAKDVLDNLPFPLKQGIDREEARRILRKIENAGGTGEIKE